MVEKLCNIKKITCDPGKKLTDLLIIIKCKREFLVMAEYLVSHIMLNVSPHHMSIAPDIEDAPDAVSMDHVKGDIRFENVSFHYEDHNEKVLSNVNLEVKPGDYVALVGTSGAGKTTLCSLIPRFYDVSSGAIYLDGKDIRKIKLKDLSNQIGIVQQDVYLFAGNIMENIRYGRPDATDEEVIRAAKLANAHDFIMESFTPRCPMSVP